MSMIDVSRASRTLASPAFAKSAVLIVAGSLAAQLLTNYARSNVYDVSMKGGDALYALVGAVLVLAVVPGRYSRPVALGMGATSVRVVLNDYNVI